MLKKFGSKDLGKLWKAEENSSGEENGQVTIIGGSRLFHGAPILAVKAASRLVDMVFFSSPDSELEKISAKAALSSFIWVPWDEIEEYIKKSEAILIGSGFLRFHSEKTKYEDRFSSCDEECQKTREVTRDLLHKFPEKKWVIDGGSLQVLDMRWIPKGAILTPNKKEFEMLFSTSPLVPLPPHPRPLSKILERGIQRGEVAAEMAKKHECVIVVKGPVGYVTDGETMYEITGGNAGLTKGGTGDVLAGVTVGLLAKNPPLIAAAAASWAVKATADKLFETVGHNFNADDVSERVFEVVKSLES